MRFFAMPTSRYFHTALNARVTLLAFRGQTLHDAVANHAAVTATQRFLLQPASRSGLYSAACGVRSPRS
jgi:hypothetical protein